MTKLVVFRQLVDLWTRLETCQSGQGAIRVSNQMPPNYKLTPNSSDLLGTELRVILTSAFIGNSKTSWTAKKDGKGKGKVHPLYRHWGSVQAVRPIGGVEV